jgi:hypothetical protein
VYVASDVWGDAGRQMFSETQSLGFGETKTLIIGSSAYAVSRIHQLGWHIAVTRPVTIFMFINNAMIVFVALVVVILFIFIIFNVYIALSRLTLSCDNIFADTAGLVFRSLGHSATLHSHAHARHIFCKI